MDLQVLREQLEIDEGVKYEVYNDHLGYATFGVGHLVLESDEEHGSPLSTAVSESRVIEPSNRIAKTSCETATSFTKTLPICQKKLQQVIANMMFNMGRPRLSKFKGMKRGVDSRNWNEAADEMVDSAWYRQVTNRADRLVARIRALA